MIRHLNKMESISIANKVGNRAMPIASVLANKDDSIVIETHNKRSTLKWNEYIDKKNKHCTHAEWIAIEKVIKEYKMDSLEGFEILVTIPPCKKCTNKLTDMNIDNIYYLYKKFQKHKFIYYESCGINNIKFLDKKNLEVKIPGVSKVINNIVREINSFYYRNKFKKK